MLLRSNSIFTDIEFAYRQTKTGNQVRLSPLGSKFQKKHRDIQQSRKRGIFWLVQKRQQITKHGNFGFSLVPVRKIWVTPEN